MSVAFGVFVRADIWSNCLALVCGQRGKKRTRDYCSSLACVHLSCWRQQWRLWLTALLIVSYLVLSFVWLTSLTYHFAEYDPFSPFKSWYVGSFYVLCTAATSFITLRQHWVHYTSPDIQRYVIRISFFPLSFGFFSWLALRFNKRAVYIDAIKELQEAYFLYCFLAYLISYLQSNYYTQLDDLLTSKPPTRLCCCCKSRIPKHFVLACKIGVLQFCCVRVLLTIVTIITQASGVYSEGEITPRGAFIYIQISNAISQVIAMNSLGLFFRATRDLLKQDKPLLKLIIIYAIIILSSFQNLFISLLIRANVIRSSETWYEYGFSKDASSSPATGIQNFLVTVEMFLASVAIFVVFSYKRYAEDSMHGDVPFVSACIRAFEESETITTTSYQPNINTTTGKSSNEPRTSVDSTAPMIHDPETSVDMIAPTMPYSQLS